jgi:predicted SprT family Zn-dependent metalloprotease
MSFTREGCKTWIALHEFAHMIVDRRGGRIEGHGPEFCEAYLKLVGWFIGRNEQEALRDAFDRHGVLYSTEQMMQSIPRWKSQRVGVS